MNMKSIKIIWLLAILAAVSNSVFAVGLGTTLSKVSISAVTGDESLSRRLQLINPDGGSKTVAMFARSCAGEDFYVPFPKLEWIEFLPGTIEIPPKSRSEPVGIKITIPDSSKYANRRYTFELSFRMSNVGFFSAGLAIPVFVDTNPLRKPHTSCPDCGLIAYPNKLELVSMLDSVMLVNWSADSIKLAIGWNRPTLDGWRDAIMLLERFMNTYIPVSDTILIKPGGKKKIFIKPLAFPGKGNLYFVDCNGYGDYIRIFWREF